MPVPHPPATDHAIDQLPSRRDPGSFLGPNQSVNHPVALVREERGDLDAGLRERNVE